FFAAKISKVYVTSIMVNDGKKKIYRVRGQLFFASVTDFVAAFNFKVNVKKVEIDLSDAHLWDDSAVAGIDKIVLKYQQNEIDVKISGSNESSSELVEKLAVYDKSGAKL